MHTNDPTNVESTDPLKPTGWPTDFDRDGLDDHDPRPAPASDRQTVALLPDRSHEDIRGSTVGSIADALACYWPAARGFVVEVDPGFRPYLPPGVRAERLDDRHGADGTGTRYRCGGCGFDRLRLAPCPTCESSRLDRVGDGT